MFKTDPNHILSSHKLNSTVKQRVKIERFKRVRFIVKIRHAFLTKLLKLSQKYPDPCRWNKPALLHLFGPKAFAYDYSIATKKFIFRKSDCHV